jgi:hypothetical protein
VLPPAIARQRLKAVARREQDSETHRKPEPQIVLPRLHVRNRDLCGSVLVTSPTLVIAGIAARRLCA